MSKEFEKLLAYHCAPAIFGLKSSNLVNVSLIDYPNIEDDLEQLNNACNRVKFVILKKTDTNILLLVYKEEELLAQLSDRANHDFLVSYGYPESLEICDAIEYLKERVKLQDFPHEIGVFLGYDLNDIKDFMDGTKKCLHVGYWKVYSNPDEKIKQFNKFTRCRHAAITLLERGYNFENVIL